MNSNDYINKLRTDKLGRDFTFITETDSTNSYAMQNGLGLFSLVCAEKQTEGRGRSGRVWESESLNSLYFTVVLKVSSPAELLPLNIVIGYGVCDAVRKFIPCDIKWPNDITSSGRKMGGMLMEASIRGAEVEKVIAGVGLNINNSDFPDSIKDLATSMRVEAGREFSKEEILAEIMNSLETAYEKFMSGEMDIKKIWSDYSANLDKKINVHKDGMKTPFIEKGITDSGTLLALDEKGKITEILTGDIGYDFCR